MIKVDGEYTFKKKYRQTTEKEQPMTFIKIQSIF